ncbi:MAG: peptidylprolyl isomerase [candidate division Zixibacteria bacterium]|nr:peptidylprolyl isomerase [candidate division Zixibacteria bacterium]
MSQAEKGCRVKVHYEGRLEDGTIFDSSKDRPPLEFEIGGGNVIPGFENGVVGMTVGDKKTVTLKPEDAYGDRRDDLTIEVDKAQFPEHITPSLGQQLQMEQPDGQPVSVTVTNIVDEKVTLDANHPLAGKTLIFDIELVEIS